jgi:hypothetical protein
MTKEQYQNLIEDGDFEPIWMELLNASGWAGILSNGNLVDRRYFPEAIPVQKNSIFGVENPKESIELSNLKAIQEYLLSRGANDEEINSKIKELQ